MSQPDANDRVAACRQDPPVRPDGLCVCGKSRTQKRAAKGSNGIRMDKAVWLANVAADPFCSTECARVYHDAPIAARVDGTIADCTDCGTPLSPHRNMAAGERCRSCADKHRRTRRFAGHGLCAGCGGNLDSRTVGCSVCTDRIRCRARRQDPVYRANDAALSAKRSQRRRDQQKSTAAARPTRTVGARAAAKEANVT